jgi:hypothetical protein
MIGTATPATLLHDSSYVQVLEQHTNPHLDWTNEMRRSRNIRFLAHLLRDGTQPLPPFIDHYPRLLSDSYRSLLEPQISTTLGRQIQMSDSACIAHLQRDVTLSRPSIRCLDFDDGDAYILSIEILSFLCYGAVGIGVISLFVDQD